MQVRRAKLVRTGSKSALRALISKLETHIHSEPALGCSPCQNSCSTCVTDHSKFEKHQMKLLGCAGQNVLVFQSLSSQQRVVTMSFGYEVCPVDQLESVEQ